LMVKRLVKNEKQIRLSGRAKEQAQDDKQKEGETVSHSGDVAPSVADTKIPIKGGEKIKAKKLKISLLALKPQAVDWKWVYISKSNKFAQPYEDKIKGLGKYVWGGGSYYEGEWEGGKPHGRGIKFWEESEYYQGDWKDGKMDGEGTYHWPDGAMYIGQWKEGYHEGQGWYIWEDGNEYRGSWKQGERDGFGVRSWVDGDVFEGDWVKGKRTGNGTYFWPNGSKFVGEWLNGSHHGFGTYTWLDGRAYSGQWEDSKKHGKGVYNFGDGCVYAGEWRSGHRHGWGIMKWKDGSRYEGYWARDRRDVNNMYTVRIEGATLKPSRCYDPDSNPRCEDWPFPKEYDNYFAEDEDVWEVKYRPEISRRRMFALVKLKEQFGKVPYPIREEKVLDPEG